jgi:hypothetical protein
MQRLILFPFTIRFSLSLISIVLIILILSQGQHILVPIVFAVLFAMLLVAPCNFLERHKIPRGLKYLQHGFKYRSLHDFDSCLYVSVIVLQGTDHSFSYQEFS